MLRQFVLRHDSDEMVCWLEYERALRPGTTLTLKETDGVRWTVAHVYSTALQRSDIKRGWSNNI